MITKKEAIKNIENFKKVLEEKQKVLVTEFCENVVSKAIQTASCNGKISCELVNTLPYEKDIENYLSEKGFESKCTLANLVVSWG